MELLVFTSKLCSFHGVQLPLGFAYLDVMYAIDSHVYQTQQ